MLKHSPMGIDGREGMQFMATQLKLVSAMPAVQVGTTTDPTRQVFEHWLFMFGHSAQRCKLGPSRRQAINGALAMGYDVETLMLAVEGMAGDSLEGCGDRMAAAMRDLEWLLAKEARIEQWADKGDLLRKASFQRANAPTALQEEAPAEVDPAEAAAKRERLRQFAAARRGGGR